MTTDPKTCGDDCGCASYIGEPENPRWYASDSGHTIAVFRVLTGYRSKQVGYGPVCGRKLGFTEDGTPTVGASYAELECDALRLDKLDEYTAFGNGISKIDAEHFGLKSWHPKVPLDFGLDRKKITRLRKSRMAARDLADALPAWDTFEPEEE